MMLREQKFKDELQFYREAAALRDKQKVFHHLGRATVGLTEVMQVPADLESVLTE